MIIHWNSWAGGRITHGIKSRSTASARLSAYAFLLQTHRQNPRTGNDHPLLQRSNSSSRRARTDTQTDGRTLPSTLSPRFVVDKHIIMICLKAVQKAWQSLFIEWKLIHSTSTFLWSTVNIYLLIDLTIYFWVCTCNASNGFLAGTGPEYEYCIMLKPVIPLKHIFPTQVIEWESGSLSIQKCP